MCLFPYLQKNIVYGAFFEDEETLQSVIVKKNSINIKKNNNWMLEKKNNISVSLFRLWLWFAHEIP